MKESLDKRFKFLITDKNYYYFDTLNRCLYENDILLNLSLTELKIISILFNNFNKLVTFSELNVFETKINRINKISIHDRIKVNISTIRKKIKLKIENKRGIGYMLVGKEV